MLWVREDRRELVHPLVVSHGANADLDGRTRYRHEFDWVGTADPTGYLTLPTAIEWMSAAAPDGGGWPAIMAANHALAVEGRDRLLKAFGDRVPAPAPDAMLGSMAALPLPGVPDERAGMLVQQTLERDDRIQVPIGPFPVRAARPDERPPLITIRISAQRYNEPADYDRLAEALVRCVPGLAGRADAADQAGAIR
jgi:isopenicillin-N epimerase